MERFAKWALDLELFSDDGLLPVRNLPVGCELKSLAPSQCACVNDCVHVTENDGLELIGSKDRLVLFLVSFFENYCFSFLISMTKSNQLKITVSGW